MRRRAWPQRQRTRSGSRRRGHLGRPEMDSRWDSGFRMDERAGGSGRARGRLGRSSRSSASRRPALPARLDSDDVAGRSAALWSSRLAPREHRGRGVGGRGVHSAVTSELSRAGVLVQGSASMSAVRRASDQAGRTRSTPTRRSGAVPGRLDARASTCSRARPPASSEVKPDLRLAMDPPTDATSRAGSPGAVEEAGLEGDVAGSRARSVWLSRRIRRGGGGGTAARTRPARRGAPAARRI